MPTARRNEPEKLQKHSRRVMKSPRNRTWILPAGVNLGGNPSPAASPTYRRGTSPATSIPCPPARSFKKHPATGGRSYLAILARRTNSIMPIGKSANKNAKSITSIRLVLVVCRMRPLSKSAQESFFSNCNQSPSTAS